MALPLIALPNIITSSLAMSLLPDVLPRLSHSNPVVRKKAIVCLYRLALVYPEALKLAWPKLKDRLTDDEEETSVTTAVINVVCELGWRRPHDFLPLAPRFFDLLVDGGNNWMAIKIIKLVSLGVALLNCAALIANPVCNFNPSGATFNTKAYPPINQYHPDDNRHVTTLRMHQWHHTRGHLGRRQWA